MQTWWYRYRRHSYRLSNFPLITSSRAPIAAKSSIPVVKGLCRLQQGLSPSGVTRRPRIDPPLGSQVFYQYHEVVEHPAEGVRYNSLERWAADWFHSQVLFILWYWRCWNSGFDTSATTVLARTIRGWGKRTELSIIIRIKTITSLYFNNKNTSSARHDRANRDAITQRDGNVGDAPPVRSTNAAWLPCILL